MRKKVTFSEDSLGQFNTLTEKIRAWMKFNHTTVQVFSSAYHAIPIEGTKKYKTGFTIYYSGQAIEVDDNIIKIVTFDGNGGIVSEGSRRMLIGDPIGTLPIPKRDLHIFDGWYTEQFGGVRISESDIIDDNITLYAQWITPVTIRWNLDGGLMDEENRLLIKNSVIGILPIPIKNDYGFIGWFTSQTGGNQITANYVVTNDITIYARWGAIYTVIFDPNGGNVLETSRKISAGNLIGDLPTPILDEHIFGGWFTSAIGGLSVTETYSVNSNITLFARWGTSDSDINFGDATTQFNMQFNGDRTNYNNNPYTIYGRYSNSSTSSLIFQTGISSNDGTNNMTDANPLITLYLKITNDGPSGEFDVGFDCDSYVGGSDKVQVTRIEKGVMLGNIHYSVTVDNYHTAWVGVYNNRVSNRYTDHPVGTQGGVPNGTHNSNTDTGYTFTIRSIFIPEGSYAILEVKFNKN